MPESCLLRPRAPGIHFVFGLVASLAAGCVVPNPSFETDEGLVEQMGADMLPADGGALALDAQSPVPSSPDAAPSPLPSSGKLCDPCDPQQPDCTEPGGLCLVVDQGESFCTRSCDKQPCPSGYDCVLVKVVIGSAPSSQCVPLSLSCGI